MKRINNHHQIVMTLALAFILATALFVVQPASAVDVMLNSGSLTITPGAVANFEVMKVRIAGPSGDLVLDTESSGESVGWSSAGMPDGTYQYEAVVLTYDSDLDSGEEDGDDGERLERTWGSLQVVNGQILVPEEDPEAANQDVGDQSFLHKLGKSAVRVAMVVMDQLVPSAHAVDLTAQSNQPLIRFDDNQDENPTPSWDWSLIAEGGINDADTNNYMRIEGWTENFLFGSPVTIAEFRHNGATGSNSSQNSIIVEQNGDIRLATGVYIDRSFPYLGIGTIAPSAEIDISATSPEIELFDETDNSDIDIVFNSPWFTIEGDSNQDIFEMHKDAPVGSLQITSNGDIGMGTTSPLAALEVRRSGNAVVLVDDNGPQLKRQMFILENNGAPSFRFRNALSGRAWTFAMTDNFPFDEFVINDPGSPGREMFLDQNGNMAIKGNFTAAGVFYASDRDLKENIEPLEGREVLGKVMELPISRWNFKNDSKKQRHIGPMAQDFQEIFGGGPDDRHISIADGTGIALAAIQGLGEMVKAKDSQIAKLQKELDDLKTMVHQFATSDQVAIVQ